LFTHLHTHTEYSMLDGLSQLEPLVARCKELGMESLAITDHGGLYGAIDFYQIAKSAGVRPIIGCEMYVALNGRSDRTPEDKGRYHLTVLAKDKIGYSNLVKLVTKSHLEGYYYKPRVDRELLEYHSEGLVVLSGCPSGEIPSLVGAGRMEEAKKAANWYRERFPDYHLELMEHDGVPDLPAIRSGLMQLHQETGIPLVATNDSHYTTPDEHHLHDILLCIQTNTNINDEKRMRFDGNTFYLRSPQEMADLFSDVPEAITNTQKIAEKCNLEMDFGSLHLPKFEVPNGLDADQYLESICKEGLGRLITDPGDQEWSRLIQELDVIRQTQYATYFLVVWDIAQFVRRQRIELAVRGSAAASLVLYCLGVTDVNPLNYNLVFERFLNVERKEMPDIDMDFQDDRREEVLNYVVEKYGSDHVAQIITFGTLGAKASLRDTGRALAMAYSDVDTVARLVPNRLKISLDEALETTPELQEIYGADEGVRTLVDTARGLEGITRHSSTHAAGVVMSGDPLDDFIPLQLSSKGDVEDSGLPTTQYAMNSVEALGLLKMDFLGLINLTILANVRDLVKDTRGITVDHRSLSFDDKKTYDLLSNGETMGVFQLEGDGMTRHIKQLKPSSLEDIASMIALFRPGPMEHIGVFIEAKHGRREVRSLHPDIDGILQETYGLVVNQEQVMLIAQSFAGYTLGEADTLRKAMGKKIPELMAQERETFFDGAIANGHSKELVEEVYALIEPFAGYGFNKAHAVSYALISYWTAYFKANFPEEYLVCLLNAYGQNADRARAAVAECRRLKIPVLPPDLLKSQPGYAIEQLDDNRVALRVGLASIKNVGTGVVEEFIKSKTELDDEPATVEELARGADLSGLNRKTLESLIMAGALDQYGDRGALVDAIERIQSVAHSETALKNSDQASMFEVLGESSDAPLTKIELGARSTSDAQKREWEIELLGFSLTGQDRLAILANTGDAAILSARDIGIELEGQRIVVNAEVGSVQQRSSREGKIYGIVTLVFMDTSTIELFVWDNILRKTQNLWNEGTLVTVAASVRVREDRVGLACLTAEEYKLPDEIVDGADDLGQQEPVAQAPNLVMPLKLESPSNGNGHQVSQGVGTDLPAQRKPTSGNGAVNGSDSHKSLSRQLTLRIQETGNLDHDTQVLDDIKQTLLNHQGGDQVTLEIAVQGDVFVMEWPFVRIDISDELQSDLRQILGQFGEVRTSESNGT